MTPRCPHEDEVLARFLDGVPASAGDGAGSALDAHVAQCIACQEYLARGRRLDALLASSSAAAVDDALAGRLLAPALASAASTPPRRPLARRLLLPLALVGAGFAAALALQHWRGEPPPTPPIATADPPPGEATPAGPVPSAAEWLAQRGAIVLPDASTPLRKRVPGRPRNRGQDLAALERLAGDRGLVLRTIPAVVQRAQALTIAIAPGQALALASTEATRQRLGALVQLWQRSDRAASLSWARVLAREPSGAFLEQAVLALRRTPAAVARLGDALAHSQDDALPLVAALVGDPGLDARLRGLAQREPELAEAMALHTARVRERPGRVALLLALWADIEARGLEPAPAGNAPADEQRARRWLAGLPPTATAELQEQARSARQAAQRRRCLLGLAARGDAAAAGYLLELVHGPRLEEALLAAYALAHLPDEVLAPRVRTALRSSRRPELLLAALASARSPSFVPHTRGLALSAEERAFLLGGGFSEEQLALAARLLRTRASPAWTNP